jgi:DNA-directed RNA polymerase beta subunit
LLSLFFEYSTQTNLNFNNGLVTNANRKDEDDDQRITQEDSWVVISAFFKEKGLVRQQLDSFDEFIHNTIQEIVEEEEIIVTSNEIKSQGLVTIFDYNFEYD